MSFTAEADEDGGDGGSDSGSAAISAGSAGRHEVEMEAGKYPTKRGKAKAKMDMMLHSANAALQFEELKFAI